ncbi:MAG: hypothetical protein M1515_04100 [Candidatus Thermoplasmatota archaeon]|nr:hypothetical protein [Candidatus Thermoplasmatota archaeon]
MSNEKKISKLENDLSNLKMSSSYGSNCIDIARIELQLSYLYARNGNKSSSAELVSDAKKTLNDPLCIGGKEKNSLLNYIDNINPSTGIPNQISIPRFYRYLSLVILLMGYLLVYLASVFIKSFTSEYFMLGIVIVFMISIAINPLIKSMYVNRNKGQ